MKVLVATIGSSGDVHPYIRIGMELRTRGHQVAILANPLYESRITRAGIEHFPLGRPQALLEDLERLGRIGSFESLFRLVGWLAAQIPPTVRAMREILPRFSPDVVLRHAIHTGVQWACEEARTPCAVGAVAPSAWLSLEDRLGGLSGSARAIRKGGLAAARWALAGFLVPPIERRLAAIRRKLGFKRKPRLLGSELEGGAVRLGLWSRAIRPKMSDDGPNSHVCGFSMLEEASEDESLNSFLDSGTPPIVFTLGSTGVHAGAAEKFYRAAVEVCRRTGQRGILLTGRPPGFLPDLPASVVARSYASHSRIFPRARLAVTHAGIGTVAVALAAGIPTVSIPLLFDQPDFAFRLKRLGFSVVLSPRRIEPDAMARAVRSALEDPSFADRARQVSEIIKTENGPRTAAEILEGIHPN
jgi:rhamnosyltransferase subunit B